MKINQKELSDWNLSDFFGDKVPLDPGVAGETLEKESISLFGKGRRADSGLVVFISNQLSY